MTIDFDQFLAVDMRVGRIVAVEDFPEARKPAWKLTIDFGAEIGDQALLGADHQLLPRGARGPPDRRGRELPAAPDRPGALRGADARRRRRGGPRDPARARRRRPARRADSLTLAGRRRRARRRPAASPRASAPGVGVGVGAASRRAAASAVGAGGASGVAVCSGVGGRASRSGCGVGSDGWTPASTGPDGGRRRRPAACRSRCRAGRCRACRSAARWCRRLGLAGRASAVVVGVALAVGVAVGVGASAVLGRRRSCARSPWRSLTLRSCARSAAGRRRPAPARCVGDGGRRPGRRRRRRAHLGDGGVALGARLGGVLDLDGAGGDDRGRGQAGGGLARRTALKPTCSAAPAPRGARGGAAGGRGPRRPRRVVPMCVSSELLEQEQRPDRVQRGERLVGRAQLLAERRAAIAGAQVAAHRRARARRGPRRPRRARAAPPRRRAAAPRRPRPATRGRARAATSPTGPWSPSPRRSGRRRARRSRAAAARSAASPAGPGRPRSGAGTPRACGPCRRS